MVVGRMRGRLVLAVLLLGLGLVGACKNITFDRETGQFSMPLGGYERGTHR